jgi:beta-lactamase regulating signal transducer with metallopeptidase domain
MGVMAAVLVPMMSATVKYFELGLFAAEPNSTQSKSLALPVRPAAQEYEAADYTFRGEAEPAPNKPEEYPALGTTVCSNHFHIPWRQVGLWAWAALSVVLVLRLVVTFFWGLRLLAKATPLACLQIQKAAFLAKAKLGINQPVSARQSKRVRSPVIWCWASRPVLLLPSSAEQSDRDMDWVGVLCHELAHWKRRDHVAGLFAELVVCVLPWNPLAWLARRRLVRLSEQACDDWVLASGQTGTDYAESLLDLTPQAQMAFAPAVASSRSGLARRVVRILQDKCSNPRTGLLWAAIMTIAAALLVTAIAFAQTRPASPQEASAPVTLSKLREMVKKNEALTSLMKMDYEARFVRTGERPEPVGGGGRRASRASGRSYTHCKGVWAQDGNKQRLSTDYYYAPDELARSNTKVVDGKVMKSWRGKPDELRGSIDESSRFNWEHVVPVRLGLRPFEGLRLRC